MKRWSRFKAFSLLMLEVKSYGSLFFVGEIMLYVVYKMLLGDRIITINSVWQLLLIAGLVTVLQYAFHSKKSLPSNALIARTIIHYCLTMAVLLSANNLFGIFALSGILGYTAFITIATFFYAALWYAFNIIAKLKTKQLNNELDSFKKAKSQ